MSVGQMSLVQVTTSFRWTTTIPRHSGNGIARTIPPENQLLHSTGTSCPERHKSGSTGPSRTTEHSSRYRQNAHVRNSQALTERHGAIGPEDTHRPRESLCIRVVWSRRCNMLCPTQARGLLGETVATVCYKHEPAVSHRIVRVLCRSALFVAITACHS